MDIFGSSEEDPYPDLYAVLGCTQQSSDEQLLVEYRNLVLTCHPDKHPDNPAAEEKFKQLQEAKRILMDPTNRVKYDRWRNSGLRIPFEKWCSLNEAGLSFHWVKKPVSQPALENTSNIPQEQKDAKTEWESETNPWVDKFRKYQI